MKTLKKKNCYEQEEPIKKRLGNAIQTILSEIFPQASSLFLPFIPTSLQLP